MVSECNDFKSIDRKDEFTERRKGKLLKKKDQIAAKEVWSKEKYNEAGVKEELNNKERKLV